MARVFNKIFLLFIIFIYLSLFFSCQHIDKKNNNFSHDKNITDLNSHESNNLLESDFQLVDKVCALVENKPILLSQVNKLVKRSGESFDSAFMQLVRQARLIPYAKKKLKIPLDKIQEAATSRIEEIKKNNKLSDQQLQEVLRRDPYNITLEEFEEETFYSILLAHARETLQSEISVDKSTIQKKLALERKNRAKTFDVLFITLKSDKKNTTPQFKKANEIRKKIITAKDVEKIINTYRNKTEISVLGPISYEKGKLNPEFEKRLGSSTTGKVTMPFKYKKNVVLIVKRPKSALNQDEQTGLADLEQKLYADLVNSYLDKVTSSGLPVINMCKDTGSYLPGN